jgi:hypothetical protein
MLQKSKNNENAIEERTMASGPPAQTFVKAIELGALY